MKKIVIIIFYILVVFIAGYFLLDYAVFSHEFYNLNKTGVSSFFEETPKYSYKLINPVINYDYLKNEGKVKFRQPNGEEYKTSPITIFGCSVGFGQYLNENEHLGSQLSKLLRRPVYNRSIAGAGLQNAYYQVVSDDFYENVPYSSDVIYIFIPDQYRRMLGLPFNLLERHLYLHYTQQNGKLIKDDYFNPAENFYRSSYLINYIRTLYYYKYQISSKHINQLSDEALFYFINIRYELKKHWNRSSNFWIIIYQKYSGDKYFKEILERQGFKVILIDDLTSVDLNKPPYLASDNSHPSAVVWKLLAPKIVQYIKYK